MCQAIVDDIRRSHSRPQRPGFPDKFNTRRLVRVDQSLGTVDRRPSELRSREVSVERVDQAEGREPPNKGSLHRKGGSEEIVAVEVKQGTPSGFSLGYVEVLNQAQGEEAVGKPPSQTIVMGDGQCGKSGEG